MSSSAKCDAMGFIIFLFWDVGGGEGRYVLRGRARAPPIHFSLCLCFSVFFFLKKKKRFDWNACRKRLGFPRLQGRALAILCGKGSTHRWHYAIPEDYSAKTTAHELSLAGHRCLISASDFEAAVIAFKRAAAGRLLSRYDVETIPEDANLSDCFLEQGVKEINLCKIS